MTPDRYPTGHLNFRNSVLFALGAPGWQITATIVVSIGIYFYLPPEGAGLEVQVSEEIFFGVLTAYGLARLIGGVIDSLADPLIGHLSDRSRSRLGRRKLFLILGIVPMVITPALLFFPPDDPGTQGVFIYLTVLLCLYYIFFTVYVAPYNALIPEIAQTEAERVELSRLKSSDLGDRRMHRHDLRHIVACGHQVFERTRDGRQHGYTGCGCDLLCHLICVLHMPHSCGQGT